MNKKDFIKALEGNEITLVRTGKGYSREYRASYNRYSVYHKNRRLNHHNAPWLTESCYYSKRGQTLSMKVWGMPQEFEARNELVNIAMMGKLGKPDYDYFYKWIDTIPVMY